jgi:Ion channel
MTRANRPRTFPILRAFQGKYGYLLAAMIVLLASSPLIVQGRVWATLLSAVFGGVLLASIHAASSRKSSLIVGLVLVMADLVTMDLVTFQEKKWLAPLHFLIVLAILVYATVVILEAVLRDAVVTVHTLQAAICVYLLMGLIWACYYALIDLAMPGSIQFVQISPGPLTPAMIMRQRYHELIYYSYSTLTTLGYGDVIPVNGFTRIGACFEAIIGQCYLAVLIGRLIGLHIMQAPPKS